MRLITVYHPMHAINGGLTEFHDPDVEFRLQEDGSLVVMKWETATERGSAMFASGQWVYVCASEGKGSL